MRIPRFLSVLLALLPISALAQTQLATWSTFGVKTTQTNPLYSTNLDPTVDSAWWTIGPGLSPIGSTNYFGGSSYWSSSLNGALAQGDYLSVTIVPSGSNVLSLDSLIFRVNTPSAPLFHYALLSSATGFDAGSVLFTTSTEAVFPNFNISLSQIPELQSVSSQLELRLYAWKDEVDGVFTIQLSTGLGAAPLEITTTAIPEPATFALLFGLCAVGAAAWRRQRRSAE
jgi:hypothetical protein